MANEQQRSNRNLQDIKDKSLIGDYIIKHTIGKGTFGKVKLAEHIVTKKQVRIIRLSLSCVGGNQNH
jgi:serine/threonine protein kinase